MNLTMDILRQAIGVAAMERLNQTPHHPKTAGGFNAWSEATKSLRDQLVIRKWSAVDIKGWALVVEPELRIVIAIASGDKSTGIKSLSPTTRSKKGKMTLGAIDDGIQLNLFAELIEQSKSHVSIKGAGVLWLLLIHVDSSKARAELSRPRGYKNGRPTGFDKRIFIDPIDLDGSNQVLLSGGPPSAPSSPEIVFEIKRRA